MTLLANLPENSAVLIGDQVLVCLPQPKNQHFYEVDGIPLRNTSFTPAQVLINKDSVIELVGSKKQEVVRYQCGEKFLSVEDYNDLIYENKTKYGDGTSYGEVNYPDLDTEFKCRKELERLQKYTPFYNTIKGTRTKVEYNIIGDVEETGSNFITNALSLGKGKFQNGNFYKVDLYGITNNVLSDFCKNNNYNNSNSIRDTLRYCKVNGEYVFSDNTRGVNLLDCRCATDLKSAKKIEDDHRLYIEKILTLKFKIVPKLDVITANSACHSVGTVLRVLDRVIPHQKSKQDYQLAIKILREVKESISTFIHEA